MHTNLSQQKHHVKNSCSRRSFLGYAGGALTAGAVGASLSLAKDTPHPNTTAVQPATNPSSFIWGNLLHLSYNMWYDRVRDFDRGPNFPNPIEACYKPYLRCDDELWEELTTRMANARMNMVVIDLGDGIEYKSHPEISVKNAWSSDRLQSELARLRKLGLEPIPKLNFSTCHDVWLGPYARQVSTPIYYKVCEDLIEEVIRLFDKPRLFHLGYDEETAEHQKGNAYVVIRQHELWWHDFEFFVKQVEQRGVRPWIWSDYVWNHSEEFFKRMPKSILQSNWYYGLNFEDTNDYVQWYEKLDQHGYDQVPTCSNYSSPKNIDLTLECCRKKISPTRLKGILQASWLPTWKKFRHRHIEAIDQVAAAIKNT